ncbi:MAG: hypothetical protein ACYTKD_24450, partial [Planctomycetota bacterium]
MNRSIATLCLAVFCAALPGLAGAAEDILIADFEGPDYGDWRATGDAFGPRPARGTLAGQRRVTGFKGKGLVNTFLRGDGTTGTLTSPEFKIARNYIMPCSSWCLSQAVKLRGVMADRTGGCGGHLMGGRPCPP